MASPVLLYQPSGGVPIGSGESNLPVYSQADVTPLVEGQAYIDVVFGSIQTDDSWVLVACEVYNTVDFEPLNIWPGIITDRTTAGFRLQLNGMPDSGNYYLSWAVSGVNIVPVGATLYQLIGPTSGATGVPGTFTVKLPPSTTVPVAITVTPSDGGSGGAFLPVAVTLSNGSATTTFDYTAVTAGAKTISVTNSGTLTDPAPLIYTVVVSATALTLSGPSGGNIGIASTSFTVALSPVGGVVTGTVTVTPNDSSGGGVFTPTTVALTTASPSQTFTYTPASAGAKTVGVTNSGGLTNPGSLIYTAVFDPATITGLKLWLKADAIGSPDGTLLSAWNDSSATGYNMTNAGGASRPTLKTNIVNGKPVVRFDGVANYLLNATDIGVNQPNTIFVVMNHPATATNARMLQSGTPGPQIIFLDTTGHFALYAGAQINDAVNHNGAFHVFTGIFNGASSNAYVDGSSVVSGAVGTGNLDRLAVMVDSGTMAEFNPGDIAEILMYDSALGSTDRSNVEAYLKAKYATP